MTKVKPFLKNISFALRVDPDMLKDWNKILGRSTPLSDGGDVIDSFSFEGLSVNFDFTLVNSDSEENGPWLDVVAFDKAGNEIQSLEPCFDCLDGEYIFDIPLENEDCPTQITIIIE